VRDLVELPQVRGIRSLIVRMRNDNEGKKAAVAIASSKHFAGLTELDLSDGRIGDAGASALADASFLPQLKRLQLGHNDIGPRGTRDPDVPVNRGTRYAA
jgi:hypothetical protein